MLQAWALEQGPDGRVFDSQDTLVPWKLNKRFVSEESKCLEESSEGKCQHVVETDDEFIFQR